MGLYHNEYTSYNLATIFKIYIKYGMNTLRISRAWVNALFFKRQGNHECNTSLFFNDYFDEDAPIAQAKCKNKPPNSYDISTWINLGYSVETAVEKIAKIKTETAGNLPSFTRRYGVSDGPVKYKQFCDRVSYSNTLEYYVEKFGKEQGTKLYNSKNDRNSFSSSRAGHVFNNTLDEYNNINLKRSESGKFESLAKTHGIERAREIIFARAGFNRTKRHKSSKAAFKFLLPIYKYLRRHGINRNDIKWGVGDSEELMLYNDKSKLPKLYDFCIPSMKLIVEYNGKVWHPYKLGLSDAEWTTWRTPFGKSADEQYNNDELKRDIAVKNGFDIIHVWEVLSLPMQEQYIFNKLGNFINEN
jgi:very-short-patch-repair endonuclease